MHSAQPSELNITDHTMTQIGIVTTKSPFSLPQRVKLAVHLHPAKLSISNETLYATDSPRAMLDHPVGDAFLSRRAQNPHAAIGDLASDCTSHLKGSNRIESCYTRLSPLTDRIEEITVLCLDRIGRRR